MGIHITQATKDMADEMDHFYKIFNSAERETYEGYAVLATIMVKMVLDRLDQTNMELRHITVALHALDLHEVTREDSQE